MNTIQKNINAPRGIWQNNLLFSIIISLFVPVALAITLRQVSQNDTAVLAVAGMVPVIRNIALYIWKRRIDWLGVIAAAGFAASVTASLYAGASVLPLKIYHPAITGVIGVLFLISAAIRRPMLLLFFRGYNISGAEHIERLNNPKIKKRLSFRTTLIGLFFSIEAIVHIVLAAALPADSYMVFSSVVTAAMIVILITILSLGARKGI